MELADILFDNLATVARRLWEGEVTAVQLTELALERIAAQNSRLNALSEVLTDTARREAARVDQRRRAGRPLGVLAGVPVVAKEIIDTTPAVCSAGLPYLADYRPARDAPVVRRLRRAGAVIVGVSVSDPGAFGVRTAAVTHPQASELTVGGSSGGSGAALAAGLCFAALGTDTGGSIRIPSACCVTSGLKPTRGRVSTEGVRPLVWSLDHVGPMTRRVSELAAVEAVFDPRFARTRTAEASGRVVVGHDPAYYADAEPAVKQGMDAALDACRSLAVEVREVSLPRPDDVIDMHAVIFCAESAAYYLARFADRRNEFPETQRTLIDLAETHTGYQHVQAMRARAEITRRVDGLFDEVSYLLSPTLPVLAPRRDAPAIMVAGRELDFTLALVRYTCLFDHTGHPVVAMPASVVGTGVGTGIQIIGPRNRDADVIAFAERIERSLGLDIDYSVSA